MPGFRVAPSKEKNVRRTGKIFFASPNPHLVQILKLARSLLELLGKPFYLSLTILFVGVFTLLLFLGKNVIQITKTILHLGRIAPRIHFVVKPLPTLKKKVRATHKLPDWKPHITIPSFLFKFIVLVLLVGLPLLGIWILVLRDLPKPGTLLTRDQVVSSKIYDRNGKLLYKIYKNQNRTLIHLDEIPVVTREATIAIEDSSFYSHPGFSVRGILRAIFRNFTHGELTGGSTITQQLVKNTLLSPEKTFLRKLREIVLAIQVEMNFPKDQILEMYFNEVSYGGAAYGIEEAAQLYFGKSAQGLDLAESALLAGLPKAPTTFSPFGAKPDLAPQRQAEVLARMVEQGYITAQQAEIAASETLAFAPQRTDIKAPHFVMWIKQLLAEKYGERVVEEGGLEVTTSLDLDLQEKVQKIVREEVDKIRSLRISNGAALVTDPQTGEVLAMVGSHDYWDREHDGNVNVTLAQRQPGSSIKPVNYSYALESGKWTAASIILDAPVTYSIAGSEPYSPRDYTNTYHGNVTLRTALGSSLNIPAVKVLASYGVARMIDQARKMGITTWNDPSRYGLSLTLGGGEVKMTDMNVVYATLANYGRRVDLTPILKVKDYRGRSVEENTCAQIAQSPLGYQGDQANLIHPTWAAEAYLEDGCSSQSIDPRVAYILTDILKDNSARTPIFGPRSLLVIQSHPEVAVKTGTTQNLRDNWAIGYTKDYVVATWVGNNDNTPMAYVASGITGATPIWHNIMQLLVAGRDSDTWPEPDSISKTLICPFTGTLPCDGCPGQAEYFLPGTEPKYRCVPKTEEENPPEGGQTPVPQIL